MTELRQTDTAPGDRDREPHRQEAPRPLSAHLIAATGALGYLAGAAAVMSSELVEVGAGGGVQALLAMVALQLALGYAVGRPWALVLCIAPALLALLPGLLPPSAEIPDYGFLFFAIWAFFGAPVAASITLAGIGARRASGRAGKRAP